MKEENGKGTLAIVLSIMGVLLTPLYILVTMSLGGLSEVKKELKDHEQLPSHPVLGVKVDGEVKRLDGEIALSRDTVAKLWDDNKRIDASLQAFKASTESKFTETETQMDSMAQSLNIQFSESQRRYSDVQNSLHDLGAKVPTPATQPWYFPNISDRKERNR
jgi:hypothetical protein